MVSYDTLSHTLFSSDLFGGFVPDSSVLESADAAYIIENARLFHQHDMPSRELLSAGLARVRSRRPLIDRIAPQHGHIVAASIVDEVFSALGAMDCGVLRIAEARRHLSDALIHQSTPMGMVRAVDTILESSGQPGECALSVNMPIEGWTTWNGFDDHPERREPPPDWHHICLLGYPSMVLALKGQGVQHQFDPDMERMLREFAESMRPWVDHLLEDQRQALEVAGLGRGQVPVHVLSDRARPRPFQAGQ